VLPLKHAVYERRAEDALSAAAPKFERKSQANDEFMSLAPMAAYPSSIISDCDQFESVNGGSFGKQNTVKSGSEVP
jgi:hypothetical protein